jgi:threonine dehydratase
MDVLEEVERAATRIRGHVVETPVLASPALSRLSGGEVFLKLENVQATGSFKLRGAVHKLLSLTPDERARGVVAASSGNHGAAVACGLASLGMRGIVFVPDETADAKVDAIRAHGAEVEKHGPDCVVTETFARSFAQERGMVYVSPYNDPAIVAGQGTIGLELARQIDGLEHVFVAMGGGGLIGGVGGYLKAAVPGIEVVACSPANSAVMHHSLAAGRILELESLPTLSDSTAGGVEPDAITFPLCRRVIDRSLLVSEDEIAAAMRLVLRAHYMIIEGAAGVAVAGFLQAADRLAGRRVAIVLCGANVPIAQLRTILAQDDS